MFDLSTADKKWSSRKGAAALAMLFFAATPSLAGIVEAKKDNVEVYAEANKTSSIVHKMKKGEAVDAKERQGMYWQVQLKGNKNGFVSVMQVKHKVGNADANLASVLREAVQKGRTDEDAASMRSRSAVMGVRGLDESKETAFAGNAKPNLRMVYNMENIVVEKEKISQLGNLVEKEISLRLEKSDS